MQETDTVTFAERLVAVAGQVAARPTTGLTTEVRATVPAKLDELVSETESDAEAPELKFTGVPIEIAKSPT